MSLDGQTVGSTGKMERYENPLHIVSAQICKLGLTLGQETVEGKSNEIPATQQLIKMLNLKGCVVVADALNCQKETASAVVTQQADYLLSVKDNQKNLKRNIEDYVQDESLRKTMERATIREKNRDRMERRTAFVCDDIDCLDHKDNWKDLPCIGAINTNVVTKTGGSNEWHYYISSKPLTPDGLLKHARAEWCVESMHWLLDVHFDEDSCRVQDECVQKNLNMIRKIILNSLRLFQTKKLQSAPFQTSCLIVS